MGYLVKVLEYCDLKPGKLKAKYEKIKSMLERDDLFSAEVKKLSGTPYYRAKLDDSNRLLLKVLKNHGNNHFLALEIIENHNYDGSKFLIGAHFNEEKIKKESELKDDNTEALPYLNEKSSKIHILDKPLSFDDEQQEIYNLTLPAIMIGSAGSGKTMLMLEKLKRAQGNILYVTHSSFLAQNTQQLYFSNRYKNDEQDIAFLSYQELLETQQIPSTEPVQFNQFKSWVKQYHQTPASRDPHKLFEEFKGVLTGTQTTKPFLSKPFISFCLVSSDGHFND